MRKLAQGSAIVIMALATPQAIAQRPEVYSNFINVCGRAVSILDQSALDRAVRDCFRGYVRISATPNSVIISYNPRFMPLIGVGLGRPIPPPPPRH